MAATSAKSGLTVEINKCRNAISNLRSCQTVINETINDLIVKTESLVESSSGQNADSSQKYLLRHKLKKAYGLLKDYENFLDGGPWKYSDDLEEFFKFVSPPSTYVPSDSTREPSETNEQSKESSISTEPAKERVLSDVPPKKTAASGDVGDLIEFTDVIVDFSDESSHKTDPLAVTAIQAPAAPAHRLEASVAPALPVQAPTTQSPVQTIPVLEPAAQTSLVRTLPVQAPAVESPAVQEELTGLIEFTDVAVRVAEELSHQINPSVVATVQADELSDSDSDESNSSSSTCRRINRSDISDVGLDTIVECEVSYIESPSSFWCRMRPSVDTKIEEELIDYLRRISQEERILKQPKLKEYCAAPYQTGYRRGLILDFKTNERGRRFAKILYVDHGNKVWVAADRLLVLPSLFYHYLWQASRCRLFGVEPVSGSWSFDVVIKFREFCEFNDLFLYSMDSEPPRHHCYTVKLLRKWGESDEESAEQEENAHEELHRNFSSSLRLVENVPPRRFRCAFEQSSTISKDPPSTPEPWQVEFNYDILRSVENDAFDSGYVYVEEEDTMLGQSKSDQDDVPAGASASRRTYNQSVNIVRGFNVPPGTYKLDSDGFLHLKLLKIVNLDEFYVSPCDPDPLQTDNKREIFRKFTEEMNEFYSKRENLHPIDFYTVKECPYAAAQLSSSDGDDGGMNFYRCRVKDFKYPSSDRDQRNRSQFPATDVRQELKLSVFFIDLGRTEIVKSATEVFLLDKRFCNLPAQVLKCNLFSTRPVEEGVRTTFGNWRSETVEEFKKLCRFDRPMKATILMEEIDRFGIVLYDSDSSGDHSIIINQELMKKGLVRSDIIWVSYMAKELCKLSESLNKQRRHNEENAACGVDVNQLLRPGVSRPLPNYTEPKEPKCIEPPEPGSIVEISVTCLFNCLKFPVTFPCGTIDSRKTKSDPTLKKKSMEIIQMFHNLCKEINDPRFVAQLPHYQQSPTVGQYCLSVFTEDKKLYRAQIIESYPDDDQYRVKYVDYGNMEYVHLASLRPLNEHLLRIPIQSLECHLSYVRPTDVACLQQNMNILWEKIFRKPQKARIVEVIKRPSMNPLLMLDLRVTDVDNSYISVNSYVVEQGWAVGV